MTRDKLGQVVRQAWVTYCREIGDDKPAHLAPWSELSETDKEADRRIGEAVWREFVAESGGILGSITVPTGNWSR